MKLTLQRVADMVGCAKSYLWMLETGARTGPPADELVRKLQHALGFKADELIRAARWQQTPSDVRRAVTEMAGKQHLARRLGEIFKGEAVGSDGTLRGRLDEAYRSGELRALVERLAPSEPEMEKPFWPPAPVLQVPLINKVAAGYPREFTDLGYPARSAAEYVHTPDLTDPDAFACRVVGDSMLPDYREGDVVVFSPARPVKSGMDCFARIEPDHESTFKRVYIEADGAGAEMIRLQPLNPAYASRTLAREQVAGLYAAVSVTRRL